MKLKNNAKIVPRTNQNIVGCIICYCLPLYAVCVQFGCVL